MKQIYIVHEYLKNVKTKSSTLKDTYYCDAKYLGERLHDIAQSLILDKTPIVNNLHYEPLLKDIRLKEDNLK